jgi:hypothetical protein
LRVSESDSEPEWLQAVCPCGVTSEPQQSELVAKDWALDHADRHGGYDYQDIDIVSVEVDG